jgi:hypothetical protein
MSSKEITMDKRNLTVSLPYPLVNKAKEMAVREERSLNEYVRQAIEEKIVRSSGFSEARERQLCRLKDGFRMGTKSRPPAGREAIHER